MYYHLQDNKGVYVQVSKETVSGAALVGTIIYKIYWFYRLGPSCELATVKSFENWPFEHQPFFRANWIWGRANARNISFRISVWWPIHIIHPVDKTKLYCLQAKFLFQILVERKAYGNHRQIMEPATMYTCLLIFHQMASSKCRHLTVYSYCQLNAMLWRGVATVLLNVVCFKKSIYIRKLGWERGCVACKSKHGEKLLHLGSFISCG